MQYRAQKENKKNNKKKKKKREKKKKKRRRRRVSRDVADIFSLFFFLSMLPCRPGGNGRGRGRGRRTGRQNTRRCEMEQEADKCD